MSNRVVARYSDGRMVKGLILHFNPEKPVCYIKDPERPYEEGTKVEMDDLKAIFFVKDLVGNKNYRTDADSNKLRQEKKIGKKLRIKYHDGESLYALTYEMEKHERGFFVFPIDEKDNNDRIFVFRNAIDLIEEVDE